MKRILALLLCLPAIAFAAKDPVAVARFKAEFHRQWAAEKDDSSKCTFKSESAEDGEGTYLIVTSCPNAKNDCLWAATPNEKRAIGIDVDLIGCAPNPEYVKPQPGIKS